MTARKDASLRRSTWNPRNPDDLLEQAWGIIANAGWDEEYDDRAAHPKSDGWHDAVIRFRVDYFAYIGRRRVRRALNRVTTALKRRSR